MRNYSRKDYLDDCNNSDMPHIKSEDRFIDFYNELGRDEIQLNQQVAPERIDFIQPKGNIIELGCHVGFNSIYWASQGYPCIGVDIAQTLINEANRRKKEQQLENVYFICSDILDLEEGVFDTIVLTEVLEHVIDPDPIIEKAVGFMHQGSKMYIAAPAIRVGTYAHVRGISEEYLREIADRLGVDIEFIPEKFPNRHYKNTQAIITLCA